MKFTKRETEYRPMENPDFTCGNCIHYDPSKSNLSVGTCILVKGSIRADYVCELWEPDPVKEPGDIAYELKHGRAASL